MASSSELKANAPKQGLRSTIHYWVSIVPGTRRDLFLIAVAALDCALISISSSFIISTFPRVQGPLAVFDIAVVVVWGLWFLRRMWKEYRTKGTRPPRYFMRHWYEVIGLVPVPLSYLRLFLLLRAVKLVIAYYKVGRADQDVSRLITHDLAFRFRDVIVDTIADAVFARSLSRVEEVMGSLDYETLAHDAMDRHATELKRTVAQSLQSKSMVGELRGIPLMGAFADRLVEDVGQVVAEILERKVIGDIMQDIAQSILSAMHDRLRELDLERIAPDGPNDS